MKLLLNFTFFIFVTSTAKAYPEFIAYGYRACVTCHFSTTGAGPLNDYGRSVWGGDLVSKAIYGRNKTDEDLANESGFLGSKELPWWFRPGFKYRRLQFQQNPGSKNKLERWITMQQEFSSAFIFDEQQKLLLMLTYAYRPLPQGYDPNNKPAEWLSREYYVRWIAARNWIISAGLMDTVFGIKNVDHTSAGRTMPKLSQVDGPIASHGVLVNYTQKNYDVFFQYFLGNMQEDKEKRQQGFALGWDYEIRDKMSLGLSYLQSKDVVGDNNQASSQDRKALSINTRAALSDIGNSVMAEIGMVETKTASTGATALGQYTNLQAMVKFARGYHFTTLFETRKPDNSKGPESLKYGFGLLAFPWPRTEIRLEAVKARNITPGDLSSDIWMLRNQLHVSW